MGEGMLILLLICLPLAWTVLLIVAVCQNSGLSDRMKQALEMLEKRLDRQQETLLQALAEFRGAAASTAPTPPLDFHDAVQAPLPMESAQTDPDSAAWASVPPQAAQIPVAVPIPAGPAVMDIPNIVEIPTPPPLPVLNQPASAEVVPEPPLTPPPTIFGQTFSAPAPETLEPPAVQPPEGSWLTAGVPAESPGTEAVQAERLSGLDEPWTEEASSTSVLPPEPPAPVPAPPEPSWVDRVWQSARDFLMRDGHFWVVAGVFVLFLGASFFVRHGIVMGWFPPALRLAATFAAGLVLTGVGLAVRRRRPSWALVVQGCGLALMYLTVVASVRVYGLVDQTPALVVMSALVVVTALLALWQNSQIVAHLSIVAAFVAPILVSEDSGNHVGLFSFYVVLNLGILGMCLVRPWRRLYLTGFSLSFGFFGLWVAQSYRPEFFNSSAPFLVIFYLFYVFIGLYTARNISLEERGNGQSPCLLSGETALAADPASGVTPTVVGRFRTDLTLTVMAPILFLSTLTAMAYKPYTLAIAAALSGAMYLALFFALRERYLPPLSSRIVMWQGLIGLNLGLALFLFDLKPEALSRWTILSLTWSIEGAMLHYIGRSKPRLESVYFGFGCLGLSALFAWGTFDWQGGRVASQFLIAGLVLGGALLHVAWADLSFDREERPLNSGHPPLFIWALLPWGVFPAAEAIRLAAVTDYQYALNWLAIVWSLLSVALWVLTRRVPVLLTVGPSPKTDPDWTVPVLIAARIIAFVIVLLQARTLLGDYLTFGYHWIQVADRFDAITWVLFFATQALAIQQARLYRSARLWTNLWCVSLVLTAGWLLFSLANWMGLPIPLPELARLTVVLIALAVVIFPPPTWDRQFPRGFVAPTTCVLAALALWHFVAMINDPARPAWMPYFPLLNTADLFQAAAVIFPLTALYRLAQAERPELSRPLVYSLGILLFVWLNLVLGRAVHHYASVPYYAEAMFRSGYFQSLAALVWGVVGIGAMITGHRAARRTQWLLGAILLVADLAKIFFIDLSKVGTVARIVSFLAVGTLLILVGYFAPLPPAAAEKKSSDESDRTEGASFENHTEAEE